MAGHFALIYLTWQNYISGQILTNIFIQISIAGITRSGEYRKILLLTNIRIFADENSYSGFLAAITLKMINQENLLQNILTNYKHLKLGDMPELKLKQLQYESDSWKRLLRFMMDENIHLKNRLSEVLKDQFDKNLLVEVEVFQNNFIKEDGLVALLRNDVAELDKLLVREICEDGKIINEIDRRLNNLRNNIMNAELQFGKLKSEFNSYLLENM